MSKYPALLLLLVLSIVDDCYSQKIGDRRTVNACFMRAEANWSGNIFNIFSCYKGLDVKSCLYYPSSCGWVIVNYEPVIKSMSGGSHLNNLVSGEAKYTVLTSREVLDYYEQLIDAAYEEGDFEIAAKLEKSRDEQYSQYSQFYNNGVQTLSASASATSQGNCADRKRGWIDMYYRVQEEYVGCTTQELTAEFDSDPDFKKVQQAAFMPRIASPSLQAPTVRPKATATAQATPKATATARRMPTATATARPMP